MLALHERWNQEHHLQTFVCCKARLGASIITKVRKPIFAGDGVILAYFVSGGAIYMH